MSEVHIASSGYEDVAPVPPIFAEEYPVATKSVTIASGVGVVEGLTVLGKVTASGKYVPCDTGASDGSETPELIVVAGFKVDATSSDQDVKVYTSGCLNIDALVWHTSFATDADKLAAFPNPPLYVKKPAFAV